MNYHTSFIIANLSDVVNHLRNVGDDVLCQVYYNPVNCRLYVSSGDFDMFSNADLCECTYVGVFDSSVSSELLTERAYFAMLHSKLFG